MSKTIVKAGSMGGKRTVTKRKAVTYRERVAKRRRIVAIGTLLTFLLGVLAQAVGASGAFAHASVVVISPSNGSVSAVPPETISISFNEGVETGAGRVQLIDSKTNIVSTRLTSSTDKSVFTLTPLKPLSTGMYALRWSVTSADGHIVTGASTFAIGRKSVTGKPFKITAVGSNGSTIALSTRSGVGGKTFTVVDAGSKVSGLELRHKQLGATLELSVVAGKAHGILPFAGEWTLTVIERVSTYTEKRYVSKVIFK